MASDQVQLKGKTLGIPNAVRSPLREKSAARTARGSALTGEIRLIGSCGRPEKSTPV